MLDTSHSERLTRRYKCEIENAIPENENGTPQMNFLLKSEPQRFRTSTGSFIFARFYVAFLAALIKYLFGLKNQNRIKTKSKNVK